MRAVVLSLIVGFLVCQLPALAEDDVSPRGGEPDFIPDTVVWSTEGVEDAPTGGRAGKALLDALQRWQPADTDLRGGTPIAQSRRSCATRDLSTVAIFRPA